MSTYFLRFYHSSVLILELIAAFTQESTEMPRCLGHELQRASQADESDDARADDRNVPWTNHERMTWGPSRQVIGSISWHATAYFLKLLKA